MDGLDTKYDGTYIIALAAFLAGACIGAGVALLVAPQTGSELRARVRTYASKTRDEFMERGREAWESLKTGKETLSKAGREGDHMEKGPEHQRVHAVHS